MSLRGNGTPGQYLTGKINKVTFQIITAYGLAVKNGFKGTEEEWLTHLSAYGIACKNGFEGTEEEWLTSLEANPERIQQYVKEYLAENPVSVDTTLTKEGEAADAKATGDAIKRIDASLGKKVNESSLPEVINTALAEAKASGAFDGKDGKDGQDGKDGKDGQNGQNGKDGYNPVRGTDYWTASDIAEIKSYVDDAILGGTW